jgi:hypothetical protein
MRALLLLPAAAPDRPRNQARLADAAGRPGTGFRR